MPFSLTGSFPGTPYLGWGGSDNSNTDYMLYPGYIDGDKVVLASDLIARDVILQGGVILDTAGYRVYCRNLMILGNSQIKNVGVDGYSWNTPGSGAPIGSLGGGGAGASGGNNVGSPVEPTTAVSSNYGSLGGDGGAGGNGGTVGGEALLNSNSINFGGPRPFPSSLFTDGFLFGAPVFGGAGSVYPMAGGGGGGGGEYNSTHGSNGGAGGGGGGAIFIAATGTISIEGAISANGGKGANGTTGGAATGGGGGGGGGGFIVISCENINISSSSSISAQGGGGGTGGGATAQSGSYGQIFIKTHNGTWPYYNLVSGSVIPKLPT